MADVAQSSLPLSFCAPVSVSLSPPMTDVIQEEEPYKHCAVGKYSWITSDIWREQNKQGRK